MTYNEFLINAALAATPGIYNTFDDKYADSIMNEKVAEWAIDYAQRLAAELEDNGIEWDEEPMKIDVDDCAPQSNNESA